jgi:hypothetical protein
MTRFIFSQWSMWLSLPFVALFGPSALASSGGMGVSYQCVGSGENGHVLEFDLLFVAEPTSGESHSLYTHVVIQRGRIETPDDIKLGFKNPVLTLNQGGSSVDTEPLKLLYPDPILTIYDSFLEPESADEWKQNRASYSGMTAENMLNPMSLPSAFHIAVPLDTAAIGANLPQFQADVRYFTLQLSAGLRNANATRVVTSMSCQLDQNNLDVEAGFVESLEVDVSKKDISGGEPMHFVWGDPTAMNQSLEESERLVRIIDYLKSSFNDQNNVFENQYGQIFVAAGAVMALSLFHQLMKKGAVALVLVPPQYINPLLHPGKNIVRYHESRDYSLEEIQRLIEGPEEALARALEKDPELHEAILRLYRDLFSSQSKTLSVIPIKEITTTLPNEA